MENMGGIMVPLILLPLALVNFKSSTFVHKVLQTSCDIVITFSIVCCCLFFIEFLDHPAQNMYQNSTPWKALWNYLFNEWSLIPNGLRMKKLWSFYSGTTLCPEKHTKILAEHTLRQTTEGILDRVVRELICHADRIVFEKESLDVTCWCNFSLLLCNMWMYVLWRRFVFVKIERCFFFCFCPSTIHYWVAKR